jgi:hypothetical protein
MIESNHAHLDQESITLNPHHTQLDHQERRPTASYLGLSDLTIEEFTKRFGKIDDEITTSKVSIQAYFKKITPEIWQRLEQRGRVKF